jgi:hypothetical protein
MVSFAHRRSGCGRFAEKFVMHDAVDGAGGYETVLEQLAGAQEGRGGRGSDGLDKPCDWQRLMHPPQCREDQPDPKR